MSNENVTVLADELGLQREYNEVKRKANVGERVRVFDHTMFGVNGIHTVAGVVDADGHVFFDDGCGALLAHYVVLVQSDIVRIGSDRFRLEQRKANVGERVVVVDENDEHNFAKGTLGTVITSASFEDVRGDIPAKCGLATQLLASREYLVLVPVESALSAKPAQEQRDDIVANLAARVSKLEDVIRRMNTQLRVAREDIVLIEEGVTDDIKRLETEVAALKDANDPFVGGKVVYSRPAVYKCPSFVPLTRDDSREAVIERAQRDVAELVRTRRAVPFTHIGFWPKVDGMKTDWIPMQRVEFVVNREKRTVVALIRYLPQYNAGKIYARGIAKCAPDDVFNVHIGRAIALRRALALPVPDEYVTAPKPTEVRVGDVIRLRDARLHTCRYAHSRLATGETVYDDSREETEVSV